MRKSAKQDLTPLIHNGIGSGLTRKQHPSNPVDRPVFGKDRNAYWKDRIGKLDNGGSN